MIRNLKNQDLDNVMNLWLDTNIKTHSYICSEYWEDNFDIVKGMMLNATIYVYEEHNVIQGFIGLFNNDIAGLFVSQQYQSNGVGKKLLDVAKADKTMLSLHVYKKNNKAIQFYLRENFVITDQKIDEHTGEIEYRMTYRLG